MTGIERLHKLIADIDVDADPELWDILRGGTEGDWDCEEHDGKTLGNTLVAIADQIERELTCDKDAIENICLIVGGVVDEMEHHILGHEGMEDSPVARWARELREALGGDGCDHAADVSVSAYDLLPQEDREAIAWVREHGGLSHVKDIYHDFRAVVERLGIEWSESELHGLMAALDRLLMPKGCEWTRYESGDLVMFGDHVENCNGTCTVKSVRFYSGGGVTVYGEDRDAQFVVVTEPVMRDPIRKANPKVIAADGEPLREGEHVYHVETGVELVVKELPKPGEYQAVVVFALPTSPASHLTSFDPDQLTHQRPDTWQRIEEDAGCTATKYNERRGTIFTTKQQVARDLVRRCRALAERERGE